MSKRLVRSEQNKMIAGVCAGIGEYFDIDPTLVRLAFALLFLFGFGSTALLYVLMWLIVPLEGKTEATPIQTVESGVQEITDQARKLGDEVRKHTS